MKKILLSIICIVGVSISADKTSTFDVKGMMCGGGCVKKINRAMDSIEGIKSREVNFEKSSMVVIYDDKIVNDKMIIAALQENNYSCSLKEKPKKDSGIMSFFKNLFN
tara:strand:- start:2990 stop:3313 length:324 start_codon:yes stop_codon:yes gene_type:complete